MKNDRSNQNWRGKALVIAVVFGFMVLATVTFAQGATTIRLIEDFVDQQGTYCIPDGMGGCILFVPPVANFIGWIDPANLRLVSVDYAGLADDYLGGMLGTEFQGTVIERPLKDGRAEVHVILHTKNALTWVVDGSVPPFDFTGPLLFGYRALDVAEEEEPALGKSFLEIKFINTAPGADLPDLYQLLALPEEGQEVLFIAIRAQANGELHELFGVPDGTPGRVTVVQTGLFMASFMGAVADGFPVERVDLKVVGR